MEECFRANIWIAYFPAHTSHGVQPADNGVFNVLKGAYRKHLSKLQSIMMLELLEILTLYVVYSDLAKPSLRRLSSQLFGILAYIQSLGARL